MQLHDPYGSLPALAGSMIFSDLIIMQNNARYECSNQKKTHTRQSMDFSKRISVKNSF